MRRATQSALERRSLLLARAIGPTGSGRPPPPPGAYLRRRPRQAHDRRRQGPRDSGPSCGVRGGSARGWRARLELAVVGRRCEDDDGAGIGQPPGIRARDVALSVVPLMRPRALPPAARPPLAHLPPASGPPAARPPPCFIAPWTPRLASSGWLAPAPWFDSTASARPHGSRRPRSLRRLVGLSVAFPHAMLCADSMAGAGSMACAILTDWLACADPMVCADSIACAGSMACADQMARDDAMACAWPVPTQ